MTARRRPPRRASRPRSGGADVKVLGEGPGEHEVGASPGRPAVPWRARSRADALGRADVEDERRMAIARPLERHLVGGPGSRRRRVRTRPSRRRRPRRSRQEPGTSRRPPWHARSVLGSRGSRRARSPPWLAVTAGPRILASPVAGPQAWRRWASTWTTRSSRTSRAPLMRSVAKRTSLPSPTAGDSRPSRPMVTMGVTLSMSCSMTAA